MHRITGWHGNLTTRKQIKTDLFRTTHNKWTLRSNDSSWVVLYFK